MQENKSIWVVESSTGLLTPYGWFETEEDCEEFCEILRERMHFVNIYFRPHEITKRINKTIEKENN